MCTGDNLETATAISIDAGIVTEEEANGEFKEYACTLGEDFRKVVGEKPREDIDEKTGKTKFSVQNKYAFKKYF